MSSKFTRRDFLKLASVAPMLPLLSRLESAPSSPTAQGKTPPNVIIIIFDALSALNLSLYGYPRKTCPNMERFAQAATVYHNHHSAGNFTTPSTASLFTGSYPWTHRALQLGAVITPDVVPYNLFRLLKDTYYQAAFTQNLNADTLLYQFDQYLERHTKLDSFALFGNTFYNHLLGHDAINGLYSVDQFSFQREEVHGSLFLSLFNDWNRELQKALYSRKLAAQYPDGLPRIVSTDVYFQPGQVIDGVMGLMNNLPSPSFLYLHLIPPHDPYSPAEQYVGMYADNPWKPVPKMKHPLGSNATQNRLDEQRTVYDEYIANLDAEFGRLVDYMQKTGIMDTSYVILTADHGELFERGYHGHSTPLLFEPVIHPPLVISSPGQKTRQDITALTSNVDILPTILTIAGLPIPDWCAGQPLPGLGGKDDPERNIFVVEAKQNPGRSPLVKASVAMLRGQYKLVHYFGYSRYLDKYEFYDLKNDPEEMQSLYSSSLIAKEMQTELDRKIDEVNQAYQQKTR